MSVTSLSFTFVNTYAPQTAKPAAPAERPAPVESSESRSCGEHRPASRQTRLVDAMMSALRELGFGSEPSAALTQPVATGSTAAATPAASGAAQIFTTQAAAAASESTAAEATVAATESTTGATATTTAAAEPAVSLESAVRQFAYELFSALRQIGRGDSSSDQGAGRVDGDGGRRHHHGHHGWRREGYGDMSQRLNALSQTFAAPTAVAAASGDATSPAAATPFSTSLSITLTVQSGQAVSPAEVANVVNVSEASAATSAPVASDEATASPEPAQTSASNPLLDAFSQLFSALKPQSAGAAPTDMADKLRSFLQTLAQALRPDSMNSVQTPQVGGLVNVTA